MRTPAAPRVKLPEIIVAQLQLLNSSMRRLYLCIRSSTHVLVRERLTLKSIVLKRPRCQLSEQISVEKRGNIEQTETVMSLYASIPYFRS
jgi:hypothetical protein